MEGHVAERDHEIEWEKVDWTKTSDPLSELEDNTEWNCRHLAHAICAFAMPSGWLSGALHHGAIDAKLTAKEGNAVAVAVADGAGAAESPTQQRPANNLSSGAEPLVDLDQIPLADLLHNINCAVSARARALQTLASFWNVKQKPRFLNTGSIFRFNDTQWQSIIGCNTLRFEDDELVRALGEDAQTVLNSVMSEAFDRTNVAQFQVHKSPASFLSQLDFTPYDAGINPTPSSETHRDMQYVTIGLLLASKPSVGSAGAVSASSDDSTDTGQISRTAPSTIEHSIWSDVDLEAFRRCHWLTFKSQRVAWGRLQSGCVIMFPQRFALVISIDSYWD